MKNNKAFRKDVWRSILNTKSRFFAIFTIVALGAGVFAGLAAAPNDMEETADAYYDESNMMDVYMLSTLGFSDEDIGAIGEVDGIKNVMAGYYVDAITKRSNREDVVRVHSLPDVAEKSNDGFLNQPVITEGRMPQKTGECLLGKSKLEGGAVKLGDRVVLENDDDSLDDALRVCEFEVVGLVDSAYYISFTLGMSSIGSGTISHYMYILPGDFCFEAYTEVYATVDGAKAQDSFGGEYEALVAKATDNLKALAPERERLRYEEIFGEAEQKLSDAQKEYDDAKSEAEQKLAEAKDKLADAEEEYKENAEYLRYSEMTLSSAKELYTGAVEQYDAAEDDYKAKKRDYDSARSQYDAAVGQLALAAQAIQAETALLQSDYAQYYTDLAAGGDPAELAQRLAILEQRTAALNEMIAATDAQALVLSQTEAQLAQSEAALALYRRTLDSTKSQLMEKSGELAEAGNALYLAREKLDDARKEIDDGWDEYEESKATVEKELEDAENEITDARNKLDELSEPTWYVLDRNANAGYVSFESDADRMRSLATVFPFLFFLVAALVALTTMTRMVDEERSVIGVYKALGYSNLQILRKYMLYALTASMVGSLAGVIVGFIGMPNVVWTAYRILYTAPDIMTPFRVDLALEASLAMTACTLLATWFACKSTMSERPASLMLPRAPKVGKRIFLERIGFIWKKLSFTRKVTCRNIFRYKKRLIMTLVGIAGCTGLILTGFGLKDSISDIVKNQFYNIYKYDTQIDIGGAELSAGTLRLLNDGDNFSDWIMTESKAVDIASDKGEIAGYFVIPSDAGQFCDFVKLRDRASGEATPFGEGDVLITEKAASRLGVGIGGSVTLEIGENRFYDFRVTGITENYVYHYLYISPEVYESVVGKKAEYNQIRAICAGEQNAVSAALLKRSDVKTVAFTSDIGTQFDDMIDSLNIVVIALIFCAGALAFVVLYNLTNININERVRELATIKVLGFYDRETSAYIYRETAMLSVMGCALGLLLGLVMHAFVIKTVEVDFVMFGRSIKAISFVYSSALTMVFSFIVDLIMRRRLNKIDMVESMKSVD